MAKRFKTAPVPSGEISSYVSDPFNLSAVYMFGSSSPFTGSGNTIVRSSDDLIIQKGGNRALSVYQRLLLDEQVQGSFSKLLQEITSRPWYVEEYSERPGDLAVRDYVAETLAELPIDDVYKGMAEAIIVGFSVAEVMWKKTKRGVIPFDIRMRDQRRFVFQEAEDSQTGFTMRCLTFNRMFEGVELPSRKFLVNRYWSQHNGDPYGSGLGRLLYPLVKFRRRALESYVLYGDRFATPTAVAKAPLSASTAEIDTIYDLISNLSQETAIVLPDGFDLNFADPNGNPEVFKNLIDYLDKEISFLICGENEAGAAEAGSRASSQVANVVRIVKASELSEIISHLLTKTLIRWIVDLNFGVDVAAPTISREFRMEESSLTTSDVSLLIQNGFKPKKGWIARHFRVELEDDMKPLFPGQEDLDAEVKFDPEKDKNLYESIFGDEEESTGGEEAPAKEVPVEEPAGGEELPAEGAPAEEPAGGEEAPAEGPAGEEEPEGEMLSEEGDVNQIVEDMETEVEGTAEVEPISADEDVDQILEEAGTEEETAPEEGTTPEEGEEEEPPTTPEEEDDIDSILRDLG